MWSSPRERQSRNEEDYRKTPSLPDNLTVSCAMMGNMKIARFSGMRTPFALSLRAWISDASKFSSSSMCLRPNISLPDSSPHTMHILRIFHVKLSYRTGGVLIGLCQKKDDTLSSHRKELLVLGMVLQIAVHLGVFPHDQKS